MTVDPVAAASETHSHPLTRAGLAVFQPVYCRDTTPSTGVPSTSWSRLVVAEPQYPSASKSPLFSLITSGGDGISEDPAARTFNSGILLM